MPTSFKEGKTEIKEYLENLGFDNTKSIMLDIGAGCGTYHKLLSHIFLEIDAVEIYEPYIIKFELKDKYISVYNCNITEFIPERKYDLVVAGDVLEHLTVEEGIKEVNRWKDFGSVLLVAVPFLLKQSSIGGNKAEKHIQHDLTPELMKERYPILVPVVISDRYGYYIYKDDSKLNEHNQWDY